MPAFPKTEDLTKVREQARTPLLAALGAGDLANQAVIDAVTKVRSQITDRVESARKEIPTDFDSLKQKADPAELRKKLDDYSQSAKKFYDHLAEHGEKTFQKLQESPQAKRVREGVDSAQGKVGETVGEVRELADDVLGKVASPFTKSEESKAEESKTEAGQAQSQDDKPKAQAVETEAKSSAKTTTTGNTGPKSTTAKSTAAKSTTTAKKPSTPKADS